MDKERKRRLRTKLRWIGVPHIVREIIFKYADEYEAIDDFLDHWEETKDENWSNVLLLDIVGQCFEIYIMESTNEN